MIVFRAFHQPSFQLRFMPIFYLLELGAFGLLYPLCGLGVAAGCGRAFERADRES
jgi:hypothetical protein